jgi:hypothetical protein
MKELGFVYRNAQAELTIKPNPNRLEGRGNIMPDGPSRGPDQQPININLGSAGREATRRLEEMVRPRDQGEPQTPRAINVSVAVGAPETAPKIKTGNATWRNKDIDQPVRITGYLGKGPDGRDYVSIDGSATGVPLDEIQYSARKPRTPRIHPSGTSQPDQGATSQGPQVTPEQIEAARSFWDSYAERAMNTPMSVDQRRAVEDYIARGRTAGLIPPTVIDTEDAPTSRREQRGRYSGYFNREDEDMILSDAAERERIFEEIFVGVDSNPGVDYRSALSLEAGSRLDGFFSILEHARVFDETTGEEITNDPTRRADAEQAKERLNHEFSGRREIRRILHDANWSAVGGGDIEAFAQSMSTFLSEYVDLIFQDPLVGTAMHMFEQAFQQTKADNGGQLPYEELAWDYKKGSSKLEDKVWTLMRQELRMAGTPDIPEWRLRRSIILARGFGVASLRFPEIAAQARLPEETTFTDATDRASRLGSIYGEAIARYLDPIEHIIEKFAIGGQDRALLYYFLTGDHAQIHSPEELRRALAMKSHLESTEEGKRLVDIVNIFRIGGPFSQSSWRSFMAMKNFSPEERRRSGIGINEGRVSGDVEDDIRRSVQNDPNFAGKPKAELDAEVERRTKAEKPGRVLEKRLAMWKDTLKANPLRVMWQWEEKSPGQRVSFLSEALGVSEAEAKALLPNVEQDLILIQENTVQALARGDIDYNAAEMLDFDKIEDPVRRENVRRYVAKIREKASAKDYAFLKSLFEKTPAEGSPFPYIIGFEDIPFSDFDFINAGGRGFARRINDYANSVKATNELIALLTAIPTTHNIEPLIKSLNNIKQAVSQYDLSIAMEVVPYLARGIIRMYDKDLLSRLPLGIGTVVGMVHDSSFAQEQYGRKAMTWDEGDKFNFTSHLLNNGLVSKKDLDKLREDVGATKSNYTVDFLRTYGQLGLLVLLYGFAKELLNDK